MFKAFNPLALSNVDIFCCFFLFLPGKQSHKKISLENNLFFFYFFALFLMLLFYTLKIIFALFSIEYDIFVRAVRCAYGKHINKSFMNFYVCTNINSDIILLFHYLLLLFSIISHNKSTWKIYNRERALIKEGNAVGILTIKWENPLFFCCGEHFVRCWGLHIILIIII